MSNESGRQLEAYFDDLNVTIEEHAVVQRDDYYPFGLTFNSWQRSTAKENKWKFQGQEHIDNLDVEWISFKWRNHDPAIGRFFNVDPLAEKFYYNSPYAFSENKVIAHVELEGLESVRFMTPMHKFSKYDYELFNQPDKALSIIRANKGNIRSASEKTGISTQVIGSIIFQEKTAGWRGDLSNTVAGVLKADNNTLSLGLGEMQVGLAAELMGMDPENLTDEQREVVKAALNDPEKSIELIGLNVKDMEEFIGRELTIEEAAYGHNAGKEALKEAIDNGGVTGNRVSNRSQEYQEEIEEEIEE